MIETGKMIPNARIKLSKDYDPALQQNYTERKDRKEWDYVGMLGVLPVRDDGTCQPGQFCKCGKDGIATLANTAGKSLDECRRLLTRSIKIRLFCYQGKDRRFQCQIERGE